MSKLSDILSQLKHSETAGDVTPGLQKAIAHGKQKAQQRRRLITLIAILVIVVVAGSIVIFLLPRFLPSTIERTEANYTQQRIKIETKSPNNSDATALDNADSPIANDVEEKIVEATVVTKNEGIVKLESPSKKELPKKKVVIPVERVTSSVRVRAEAFENAKITGKLLVGESAEYIRSEHDWYFIRLNNGIAGYVHQSWTHLTASSSQYKKDQTLVQKTENASPSVVKVKNNGSVKPEALIPAATDNLLSENIVKKKIKSNDFSKTSDLYKASHFEKQNNYNRAISFYRKILSSNPEDFIVSNKIGHLMLKLGLKDDANEYIDKALTYNPSYVPALINAGIVRAQSAKFVEAEAYFLKALSVEEQNFSALFNVALLYEVERNYDNAKGYYSKLKNLGDRRGLDGLKRIGTRIK